MESKNRRELSEQEKRLLYMRKNYKEDKKLVEDEDTIYEVDFECMKSRKKKK